ncbi:Asp23/Gls24 family envelope stress response protein [Nocardioides sp. AX2bis]|uniref:Asp23/Gls24 family envelope stress response protein n=1 Tax=Nocardioides sp. AX2bis TaxID=2653157 RepID=UPI0012F05A22|nr:Asp23/Gls24 family envelope stress response protein [Nocardioides sp. AX2bis]VXC02508.1 conserved hypothetical protein [Nocardioides sp. AX2bis]
MAELPGSTLVRAEERGTLDVRTRALTHLVERAALEVAGSVRHRTTLGKVRGSDLPHASLDVHGHDVRVTVDIACRWPADLSAVTADVRDRVRERVPALSGLTVTSVDVTAHTVAAAEPDRGRA